MRRFLVLTLFILLALRAYSADPVIVRDSTSAFLDTFDIDNLNYDRGTGIFNVASSLTVGTEDTAAGAITLFGPATGEGGELKIHPSNANQGAFEFWGIDTFEDDLRIFTSDGVVIHTFTAGGGLTLDGNLVSRITTINVGTSTDTNLLELSFDLLRIRGALTVDNTITGPNVTSGLDPGHTHTVVNQDLWETITGDTGTATASTPTDTVNIIGDGDHIATAMVDPNLTISLSTNFDATTHSFNGQILETISGTVTEAAGVVSFNLEASGGGDLTVYFSDQYSTIDTTPAVTVALTVGSAAVPQTNYVFIPQSTKTLTANTTGFPSAEHAPIATVALRTAALTSSDGALKVHLWTDHAIDSNSQGHISHINAWVRSQFSTWIDGVVFNMTIVGASSPDDVFFDSTSGNVLQLHSHDFPAFDMATGSDIHVVNDSVSPYDTITNLNVLLTDASGGSMSNRYFTLVIWGIVSEDSGESHIMVNLPSGSYSSQATAVADSSGFTVFGIPSAFMGASFLISSHLFKHSPASSGTWTLIQSTDLRGSVPSNIAGVGGSVLPTTTFADGSFDIFNTADNTKEIIFDASAITTGNTRTIIMADTNVTLHNTYTDAESISAVEGEATLDLTGAFTVANGAVFNEAGADRDFRVEGVSAASALVVQGSDGFVGMGLSTPLALLMLESGVSAGTTDGIRINAFGPHIDLTDRSGGADDYRIIVDTNNLVIKHDADGTTFADTVLTVDGASLGVTIANDLTVSGTDFFVGDLNVTDSGAAIDYDAGGDDHNFIGDMFLSDMLFVSVDVGIDLTGLANQGDYPITETMNDVTVVVSATGDAITLPAAEAGLVIAVKNIDTTDTLELYPASGDRIDLATANTPVSIPAGEGMILIAVGTTFWDVVARY